MQLDVADILKEVRFRVRVHQVRCHVTELGVGRVGSHQGGEEGDGLILGKLEWHGRWEGVAIYSG